MAPLAAPLWLTLAGLSPTWLPGIGNGQPPHQAGGLAGSPRLDEFAPYEPPADFQVEREQAQNWDLPDHGAVGKMTARAGKEIQCISMPMECTQLWLNTVPEKMHTWSTIRLEKHIKEFPDHRFTRRNKPRFGDISRRRLRRALAAFTRSLSPVEKRTYEDICTCMQLVPKIAAASVLMTIGTAANAKQLR